MIFKGGRYAVAIGEDADQSVLACFTGDPERVLFAETAASIAKCMSIVTMTVTARSNAQNPNAEATSFSVKVPPSIRSSAPPSTEDDDDVF